VAQLQPRALGSLFVTSYDSQGCGGGILTCLHTVNLASNWSSSYFVTDGQSASPSWCRALLLLLEICGLSVVGRSSWWEDGSVIYLYNSLSFLGPSPAELMTTSYCFIRDNSVPCCRKSILTRHHSNFKFRFKLYCYWRSVGQFVLVLGPFWGPWPDFNFLCLTINFFLLHIGHPLWQEDVSVIVIRVAQDP
jgi:hypothetical protein